MGYKTILKGATDEFSEKKSRFIGQLLPITSEEEAKAILNDIKKAHRQANHSCWAYRLRGQQMSERYSDDGEPSGTAGMPMLEVLRGAALENVLVVATRYFGGTKLGTGGLVRAYTQSAQSALAAAEVIEINRFRKVTVTVDYTLSGKLDYDISSHSRLLEDTEYGAAVTFTLYVRDGEAAEIQEHFMELTGGKCVLKIEAPLDGYCLDGKVITGG